MKHPSRRDAATLGLRTDSERCIIKRVTTEASSRVGLPRASVDPWEGEEAGVLIR